MSIAPGRELTQEALSISSSSAHKGRIAATWLHRLKQCLGPEQEDLFRQALQRAGVGMSSLDDRGGLEQAQLDLIVKFIRKSVPDITLRLFSHAELLDLGLIGYAAVNSGSLGRALDILYQYHSLTSDRYNDQLEIVGERAVVTAIPLFGHVQDMLNVVEDSFSGNWRSLQILLGPAFEPGVIRIEFEHSAPSYLETYRTVFAGAELLFDAGTSALSFPARWLEHPVDHATDGMEDVYTSMCERVLGPGDRSADTAQRVRRLLLSRPGRKMLRLEEAADFLRLSATQLRKRLYRANTSYKQLVLEIRMELAKHYLLDTRLTVQEIAYLLDYSQPAPFSRAFKLQCGLAPDKFRREHNTNPL